VSVLVFVANIHNAEPFQLPTPVSPEFFGEQRRPEEVDHVCGFCSPASGKTSALFVAALKRPIFSRAAVHDGRCVRVHRAGKPKEG